MNDPERKGVPSSHSTVLQLDANHDVKKFVCSFISSTTVIELSREHKRIILHTRTSFRTSINDMMKRTVEINDVVRCVLLFVVFFCSLCSFDYHSMRHATSILRASVVIKRVIKRALLDVALRA